MDEEIIFKGEWFLPDDLDNKINGILTYKPYTEFSELELFGHIGDYSVLNSFDLILGRTFDGTLITIHKCTVVHYNGFPHHLEKKRVHFSRLKIDFIFTGVHINNVKDLVFNKLEAEIYNLENWVNIEGFSDVSQAYNDDGSYGVDFSYIQPKSITFNIRDGLDGAFNFLISSDTFVTFKKEHKYIQKTTYSITSSELVSFQQLLYDIYVFQNFLVTATFMHTNPFHICLHSDKFHSTYNNGYDEMILPTTIKLYFKQAKKIDRKKPKASFEMLFTYSDIEEKFPDIIKKWYSRYNVLADSFGLFFYQFYISDKYLNILFLNLAQAAESFHYHLNPKQKLIESSEFKKRKKEIKECLPVELFSWIESQISNNLYLDVRLSELLDKYCNDSLLGYIGDIDLFKKNIKNTRNYHTHFNHDLKNKALKGNELYDLYVKLRMFLISAFLIETGFEKELVSEFFHMKGKQVFNVNM